MKKVVVPGIVAAIGMIAVAMIAGYLLRNSLNGLKQI